MNPVLPSPFNAIVLGCIALLGPMACDDSQDETTDTEESSGHHLLILYRGADAESAEKWKVNHGGRFERFERRKFFPNGMPQIVQASDFGEEADKPTWLIAGICAQEDLKEASENLQKYFGGLQTLELKEKNDTSSCPLPRVGMVTIPGGDFIGGCIPKKGIRCDRSNRRQRKTVATFQIDIAEATVHDYLRCVEARECTLPIKGDHFNWDTERRFEHPINGIDWHQARTYCRWQGKELPSSAEWEKAARGSDTRPYPWGDTKPECDIAVYAGSDGRCKREGTGHAADRQNGASPFGLYDMAGNVREWIDDLSLTPLSRTSVSVETVGMRTVRGGGWMSGGEVLTLFDDENLISSARLFDVGVRCVKRPDDRKVAAGAETDQGEEKKSKKRKGYHKPKDDMIEIPQGYFWRGCDSRTDQQCYSDASPMLQVFLGNYRIDRTEVRVVDYLQCVKAGVCTATPSGGELNWGRADRADHPINGVTWYQADTYCKWLGKSLPTEAEWEKAARGVESKRDYLWEEGKATCESAAVTDKEYGCSSAGSAKVGTHPKGKSPYGVVDMLGNATEWVQDWYHWDAYQRELMNTRGALDSLGGGQGRVYRGGSWRNSLRELRITRRFSQDPSVQIEEMGFRCVRLD